ncbi:GNAT family N-acetyltransferase [Flavobacterium muglaense]|uniref:GNAT family N-acetyltransferase n=1 Tax=Flavobacterium muglaense TaxID=2764716 RepID=A0A923MXD0_9FLAO|nr:GNAT family N-acetyltransferase [Flavobacterium muglaense]MBC5836972.1 GNAT family N-acetyltransferase [Flavobacterium muglaense]MBC5843501.1 GNAT family N-acetyltransferase [Flavobacterium muglaense]
MEQQIKITRTTSEDKDFIALVRELDKSLWETYPELQSNYWGNNIIELNPNAIVVYIDNVAVACSCFKKYDSNTIEIKRMFVSPDARGKRLAQRMLQELEAWAATMGFSFSVLETLYKQEAAIGMYQKAGYSIIENYPPYEGLKNSICMKKSI